MVHCLPPADTVHNTQYTGHRVHGTGYRAQGAGRRKHRAQGTGRGAQGTGYRVRDPAAGTVQPTSYWCLCYVLCAMCLCWLWCWWAATTVCASTYDIDSGGHCSLLSALCSLLSALCSLLSALCSLLSALLRVAPVLCPMFYESYAYNRRRPEVSAVA
jgi:hypothetical protein